ncbi:PTS sugar transporter subunit IIA [Aeromicrobium ginsengisoli]|uniref:PTS glucose transporter subunit IIA n=1 Tax=Aeromicrobium ginsengisoli TaxID=363867 RepID=A0A5M4FFG0_9ACTN|nr:PTS glucose transporter subunit IIA [Aeromicrobium ginsengisoli]KAA1398032.1 PTS glucose transporter subunit IIA [Aeromicrobium ginsengisoli]
MTTVSAPVAGTVIALADVPDPVFAQQIVGSGIAIDPERAESTVVAPADGRLLKLHPHAFVLLTTDGKGLLVHLGIDTVQLEGDGFELLVTEGDEVTAGTPIVRWNPAEIEAGGRSPVVPVVVMDSAPDTVQAAATGAVRVGEEIFTV